MQSIKKRHLLSIPITVKFHNPATDYKYITALKETRTNELNSYRAYNF